MCYSINANQISTLREHKVSCHIKTDSEKICNRYTCIDQKDVHKILICIDRVIKYICIDHVIKYICIDHVIKYVLTKQYVLTMSSNTYVLTNNMY